MLPLPAIAQSLRKQGHKSGTMKGIITEFELDLCIVVKKKHCLINLNDLLKEHKVIAH